MCLFVLRRGLNLRPCGHLSTG